MSNVLNKEKKNQVEALGRLGLPLRAIEEKTGIRRETASRYLRAAGIEIRKPGNWGHAAKPTIEVTTGPAGDAEAKAAIEASPRLDLAEPNAEATISAPLGQRLRAVSRLHRRVAEPRPQCQGDLARPG